MKFKIIAVCMALGLLPALALADIQPPSPATQSCKDSNDCTVVSQNCATSCATLPINTASKSNFMQERDSICGNSAASLPHCNVSPPLQPVCINSRCTVGYAYQNNADAKDYVNGGRQPPTRP